ncbi:MAG: hypothetical protein OER04_05870 [Cyclobacteriaceae bacterium]|nr:hypothetical protein [Cyclobacteriaceae bacterium]
MKTVTLPQHWWDRLQFKAVLVFVAVSFLLPFLMHFIPPVNGLPIGVKLLPIFYAPFIAAYLYRYHVSLLAAISAPALNYLVTGFPQGDMLLTLSLELVLFVSVVWFLRNSPGLLKGLAAVVAYVLALSVTALILGNPASDFVIQALSNGWMGVLVLLVINLFILKFQKHK